MFCRKGVLKNVANFIGIRLCWSVFLIKFVKNFVKRRLQHRYFHVKFAKILRASILKNIYERLLLHLVCFNMKLVRIKQFKFENASRENRKLIILIKNG